MQTKVNKKLQKYNQLPINIHINSTVKNTLVNVVTDNNDLLLQISSKSLRTSKKQRANNFFILKEIAKKIIKTLKKANNYRINVFIKGTGYGKKIIFRLLSYKFKIVSIHYCTATPFNGCRPKKMKRR